MKFRSSAVTMSVILLTIAFSCTTQASKSATTEASQAPDSTTQQTAGVASPTDVSKPAGDDEINETGLLKEVEDAGYPFATLTIEFPKQQFTEHFTINLGEVNNVTIASLSGMVGKYISFRYTSELTNALLDIQVDGKSLLDGPAITAKTKKVSGSLGADEITTGDVPGLITITAPDGEITEFPFFITSELLEVNGSVVTAFYEERTTNTIKAITLPK